MHERPNSPDEVISALKEMSFDNDGIISNTRKTVARIFNERFGTNHTSDEVRDWLTVYHWGLGLGLSRDEARAQDEELWHAPHILIQADPMPGAREFIERAYYEYGVRIPIVSSRRTELRDSTVDWYGMHIPVVKPEQIHVKLPDVASGELSKLWIVRALGKKRHLDDSHTQVQLFLDYTDDIDIIYLSSRTLLDHYLKTGRLTRITGKNGNEPTMWQIYDLFFGPRP